MTATSSVYTIDNTYCDSEQTDTITYFLSNDEPACSFNTVFTLSTEHGDEGITDQHCCQVAVDDVLIMEGDYSNWCSVTTVPSDDAELEWDDVTDICTMASGSIETVYTDAGQGESERTTVEATPDETVSRHLCCLAYDATTSVFPDFIGAEL